MGGGTGGTAAALQAARRGANTVLVSEFPWLGGMLTVAGVSAPDGNELLAFQTGIWGKLVNALRRRQPGGLDNAWVSFFTYEPRVGAAIFADWVKALPNLTWIAGKVPRAVLRQGDCVLGVEFDGLTVYATVTLDGTELGDLLALGQVPFRWGWETQAAFAEPSAPRSLTATEEPLRPIIEAFPVQAPTWVVVLQDAGAGNTAAPIAPTDSYDDGLFRGAWEGYGAGPFLSYGQLPQNQFMINWPHQGNDYGCNLNQLVEGESAWRSWATAAIAHSQNFAHFIQRELGSRYGLATGAFPDVSALGGGAFALGPYHRESRRLIGLATVTEPDLLPVPGESAAALPVNDWGQISAIAIGNYPNDHHYPGFQMPLAPKSMHWGGRWTGTPFAIPYEALVPAAVDGLLVCEKNISVSHIANGATRLQPVVLGVGQAAGMAAALCVEAGCQPRELPVRQVQAALIDDPDAPAAVVPLLDVLPEEPDWPVLQYRYLNAPEGYLRRDRKPPSPGDYPLPASLSPSVACYEGSLDFAVAGKAWRARLMQTSARGYNLVTLHPVVNQQMQALKSGQNVRLLGILNQTAGWLQVMKIT